MGYGLIEFLGGSVYMDMAVGKLVLRNSNGSHLQGNATKGCLLRYISRCEAKISLTVRLDGRYAGSLLANAPPPYTEYVFYTS